MENLPKAIFISGTDTSVGKTVVTSLLASHLKSLGKKVGVIKPFQTGTESEPFLDVEFIYKILDEKFDLNEVCPFRLQKPLSPYSAAKIEGCDIPLDLIITHCKEYISRYDITLVEGAGGLYVPILKDYLIADLASDLDTPVILVTRPSLGTINHTLLSVEYLRQKNISFLGLIINGFQTSPDIASLTNLDVFNDLYKLNLLGVIPHFGKIYFDDEKIKTIKSCLENYFSSIFGGSFIYEKFVNTL